MKNTPLLFSTIAAVTILSACGGGGSNDSTSFNGTAGSPYRPLQTTIPAPSYTAGSRELAEFNTLNEQRAKCGFGLLANNEQLKFAAIDHVAYLTEYAQRMTDAGLSAHGQYSQYPNGFTGATPLDRAKYRGYTGRYAGETIAAGLQIPSAVRVLLSAPYHAGGMLYGYDEVGVSVGQRAVFDLGLRDKPQRADRSILTYPCQGVTGVATELFGEIPSPYSPRNLRSNPIGQSIYFLADESALLPAGKKSVIEVTDVVVTEQVTGVPVVMLPVQNKDNDVNALFMGSGFAYAAPDQPLKKLTPYRVRATVRSNGVTTLVDYTFATGG
jgi:uncharacterized protein YkwD